MSQSIIRISVVLALAACGGPPQSLSLDPLFTPLQVAQIQDARDQWCETNGWCPTWAADGEAHIRLVTHAEYLKFHREKYSAMFTYDYTVRIDSSQFDRYPEMFWVSVAHEMGHLQGMGHHGHIGCTMFWYQPMPVYTLACEEPR